MKRTNPKLNQSQLAKLLSERIGFPISRQRLSQLARQPGAPKSLADLDGWLAFLEEQTRDGAVPKHLRAKIAEARHRVLTADAERKEMDNEVQRRALIPFCEVEHFIKALIGGVVYGELERMQSEFPVTLYGKPQQVIADEVKRQLKLMAEKIRFKMEELDSMGKPEVKAA